MIYLLFMQEVYYNRKKVYIRAVLTHSEYDLGKWKEEEQCQL